jgi:hypothetical protein
MAKQLSPSPLPGRVAPPLPPRHWLWSDQRTYDAVLVPDDKADQLLLLLAHSGMLRHIAGFYWLVFDTPVSLDPAQLGAVLPLRALGAGVFSTYDLAHMTPKDRGTNRLHIILQGQATSYDLHQAAAVNPMQFWDMTGLDLHRANPLPRPAAPPKATTAPPAQIPRQSKPLAQIADTAPVYADIHDAVNAAKSTNLKDSIRQGGRLLRGIAASVILILLVLLVFFLGVGIVAAGAQGGLLGLLVAFAVVYGLLRLFSGPKIVVSSPSATQSGASRTTPKYRGPGVFDRLKSWALWNTQLGNKLRADLSRHINDVSRMIENGEIDRALKRALALGAEQDARTKKRSTGPTGLPKTRASLDMDFSGIERASASILDDGSFHQMARQYRMLACKLSDKGDHRRAAFIYSELLKDVPTALSELEKLKAFEDAAKLATARNSAGHVTARLWFLAGKKDIARALAKRYDAMEFIANTAEKTDPTFAAFVRGHWIKDLMAAGDLSTAVIQSADRPALATLHTAVTKQAVLAGLLEEGAVLAAATKALDWREDALDDDFTSTDLDAVQQLETYLHHLLHGANSGDAPARQALLAALRTTKTTPEPFCPHRAPLLADALIRATLAYDHDQPAAAPLKELQSVASSLRLSVLAEDLRRVVRAKPKAPPERREFTLPSAPPDTNPHWKLITCVGRGHTLLGAANGELTLLDKSGKRCWTDHMTGLAGMIPIGPGRLVLILQKIGDETQLTLLDTTLHTYRALGRTTLVAWHQTATTATWLVQTPNAIGALDVSALLEDSPRFDLLWSVTQTVPIIVLGFHVNKHQVQWISQRVDQRRPGLIEVWALSFSTQKLSVNILDPSTQGGRNVYAGRHLWTTGNQFWPVTQSTSPQWKPTNCTVRLVPYDYAQEQDILSASRSFFEDLSTSAAIIPLAEGCACVINGPFANPPTMVLWQQKAQSFPILEGSICVAQSSSTIQQRLAFIDDHQRIIICDVDASNVTFGMP